MSDKWYAILLSLGILGQGMVVRRSVGTWLCPGGLYALFWFLFSFPPLVLFPQVPVEPMAIAYILVSAVVFSLSAACFDWGRAMRVNRLKSAATGQAYDTPLFRGLFYGATLLSLVLLLLNSEAQGITLHDLASDFYTSANQYLVRRYAGDLNENIYGKLAMVLIYVAVMMGGFLCHHARTAKRRWAVIFLSFLPSIFVMVTQSARGMLLLSLGYFFGALVLARLREHKLGLGEWRSMQRLVLYGLLLVPLVAVSFISKGLYTHDDSDYMWRRLLFYFSSYSSAHLYAFSDWFAFFIGEPAMNTYAVEPPAHGFHTFMSVFRWFGSERPVPVGYYDEYFLYDDLMSSNVYTIFRGLISDFGLTGSLVFLFAVGFGLHLSFYLFLMVRRPAISAAIFVLMFGYIYNSFTISLLIWNSVYASFVLLCGVLILNNISWRRRVVGPPQPAAGSPALPS
jgi:oligosaccharide repeat unit polymerase